MSTKPIVVPLANTIGIRVGPVQFINAEGKLVAHTGLTVTARITADMESDEAVDDALELPCLNIGKGFYVAPLRGEVLTVDAFGELVGQSRAIVFSDDGQDFRVAYPLLFAHPRVAKLVNA